MHQSTAHRRKCKDTQNDASARANAEMHKGDGCRQHNTAQLTALARRRNEPCNVRKQKGAGTFVTAAGIRMLIQAAAARTSLVCAKGVKCM
jgi:hypothetical protein